MVDGQVKAEACPRVTLNSGHSIPVLGLGTFLLTENPKEIVKKAVLEHGYRHIDTAKFYGNEQAVGEAVAECIAAGVPRSELFITTKLWHDDYNDVEGALRESLRKLGLDYVDLYLVHWMRPVIDWTTDDYKIVSPPHHVIWKSMEACQKAGLTKSIGVSNATMVQMADLLAGCEIRPALNQIEVHPYLQQTAVKRFHQKWGVYVECYAAAGANHWPLRPPQHADVNVLADPVLAELAQAKGKTAAQVAIAWAAKRGTIPLVKTTSEAHLAENMAYTTVELSEEDMAKIDALDRNCRLFEPKVIGVDEDWGEFPYFE